ncbi:DUF819 family protein [Lachnospiraceae bacterium NSJ-143]|nr:DUF819 family protein [Lachnospiraceae bacterium NSJ-143]
MITSTLGFYAFLITLMSVIFSLSKKFSDKLIFKILPGMVWLMLIVALSATFNIFDIKAEGVITGQNLFYSTFLPMMLIMFMLTCDIRDIIKLGPKMILSFLSATVAILSGFTIAFLVMKNFLPENAWSSIAASTGAYIGETINMAAVASAFGVEGINYVYAVVMGTFGFTITLSISMWLIPRTKKWNEKMKASTDGIDEIARKIDFAKKDIDNTPPVMLDYCKLFAVGMIGTLFINWLIPLIPPVSFLTAGGWRVILSSVLGILLGLTPAHRLKGAQEVANVFLYLSLCISMSYSDLGQCVDAPAYMGLIIIMLIVMYIVWILLCKIFKFDLFTAEVGLMANIGGTGSAPAIAATHNPNWISFGILLGFFGDLIGTGVAIAFGNFLHYLSLL